MIRATSEPLSAAPQATRWWHDALVHEPMAVLALLLVTLALIFQLERGPLRPLFKVVPALVFCYFVPTALSNLGVIPGGAPGEQLPGYPLYEFTLDWLLPASLLLLVLAVDLVGILRLGPQALLMFGAAVVSIILGGPLALLLMGWAFEPSAAEQAWRGLAALSGSWIGGGANFTSIGRSVGVSEEMLGVIVVLDVASMNVWMVVLLWFAGRHERADAKIGADTRRVDAVQQRAERYAAAVAAPTDLPALLALLAIAFAGTWSAAWFATAADAWLHTRLPDDHAAFEVLRPYTWKILGVTALGLALSFTPARRLEGKGASRIGMVFLFLLIASIGARADFARVFDARNLPLIGVAAIWMAFHAGVLLLVRRLLRAPIFFAAVGSTACIGGTASSSIVAAAFGPGLVPVGVLLATLGYVAGTLGGIVCAVLLRQSVALWHG